MSLLVVEDISKTHKELNLNFHQPLWKETLKTMRKQKLRQEKLIADEHVRACNLHELLVDEHIR